MIRNIWTVLHHYLDKLSVPGSGNRLQRYGFVLVITLIFFFIKMALVAAVGTEVPFLFALFIVIICAWIGGFGPGVLATILSGSITYYFYLEPKYTIFGEANIPNAIVLVVFFAEGLFISMMSEAHRKSDIHKSEFIGVISHELKNPLTSIKGYAEIIQRLASKNGESKLAEFAVRIDQQVKQVIEMINEMLDITKIETGRLTYQDETFNITDLVKEIVSDLQVTTNTHKIHFSGKINKLITGDRYRIGQVVTNLVSNAIKYAPYTKKVNVAVEGKRNGIVISVQDFGPGIAKEDQAKLFDPFFRAKNTQSAKGTGIGLFISSQIVNRHKGRLWVESTIGKGSTFYVFLKMHSERAKL
jgi:signal transduction histidine kinase